jgi:hypothetical protein
MQKLLGFLSTLTALALLAGCVAGGVQQSGPHLSPAECSDLAALKRNPPGTKQQRLTEIAVLRRAGYDPSPWNDDPNYPDDLNQAQHLVDQWFATDCQQVPPAS